MELREAVVKRCIVCLIIYLVVLFTCRRMLNDLIGDRVVSFRERLRVPLDRNEALLDEILLKVRCICWLDYASATLFGPVAD